jgi:hypothetical protein
MHASAVSRWKCLSISRCMDVLFIGLGSVLAITRSMKSSLWIFCCQDAALCQRDTSELYITRHTALLTQSVEQDSFSGANGSSSQSRNLQNFMEPEGSLPCQQQPEISRTRASFILLGSKHNPRSVSRSVKWLLPFRFLCQTLCQFLFSAFHAVCRNPISNGDATFAARPV